MSSERVPVNKINDNIWQIPKTYKDCMRVPGILYADEDLLEHIKQDLTLEQLANVACLPGVLKHALAMPDAHQGYGFPIGGVAATDYSTGVISPGGVGYDINCLSPNSRILTENGYWVRLEELPGKARAERIKIYNDREGHNDSTPILFISTRNIHRSEAALKITTQCGRIIEGSLDHPILTSKGYKIMREINKNDYLVVNPFEGVEYEEKDLTILDENDFKDYDKQIIKYLKERDLIPLKMNDPRIGVIARILGFSLGDGSIVKSENRRERYITYFYARKSELEEVSKDLEKLRIKASKIYSRSRLICIKTPWGKMYKSNCTDNTIKISSNAFSLLLNKLGMPIGRKTEHEYGVPGWIVKSPLWV
ncbi:MAG: RtcB family protein, partial [Candidatus Odinarchaeota archaeon]